MISLNLTSKKKEQKRLTQDLGAEKKGREEDFMILQESSSRLMKYT